MRCKPRLIIGLGLTLEFFCELFALLHGGGDTLVSAKAAYGATLRKHHNFFQAAAFTHALKRLPERHELLKSLQGAAELVDVSRELVDFVTYCQPLARFMAQLVDEIGIVMERERKVLRVGVAFVAPLAPR